MLDRLEMDETKERQRRPLRDEEYREMQNWNEKMKAKARRLYYVGGEEVYFLGQRTRALKL